MQMFLSLCWLTGEVEMTRTILFGAWSGVSYPVFGEFSKHSLLVMVKHQKRCERTDNDADAGSASAVLSQAWTSVLLHAKPCMIESENHIMGMILSSSFT